MAESTIKHVAMYTDQIRVIIRNGIIRDQLLVIYIFNKMLTINYMYTVMKLMPEF